MFSLDDSAARNLAFEHVEVIRDDGFDFLRGPWRDSLRHRLDSCRSTGCRFCFRCGR